MADEKDVPAPPPQEGPVNRVNELSARLRIAEQRFSDLRQKVMFVEQNMISNHRHLADQLKSVQDEVNSVKRSVQDVKDNILKIVKELRHAARKEDIDVVKRYVEMWDPVKFVTFDQVQRMIDDALGRSPVSEEVIVEPEEEQPDLQEEFQDEEVEESGQERAQRSSDLDSIDFESLVDRHDRNV